MRNELTSRSDEKRGARLKTSSRPWALLGAALFAISIASFTSGCVGSLNGQPPSSAQKLSLMVSPGNLTFGNVAAGKKMSQAASLTNTGSGAAVIAQISSSNNQFSVTGLTFPLTLSAGQTANFLVWFNGSTAGKTSATLSVQAADSAVPPVQISASASATMPQPQLVVSPAALDAGSATVGTKTSSTVTLSNNGTADLTISVLSVTGGAFSLSGITTPKVISAGTSAAMTVNYAPTAAQADAGSISITSNDPASPTTIALSGTGTSAPVGHLTLNPSTLAFGNVNVGSTSVLTSTVTNTGQGPVHISQVFASGASFSQTGLATPATLNAGQSAQIHVTYAPTSTTIAGGTVGITTDAPGAAPGLSLSGTGVQPAISLSPASIDFGSLVDGQSKTQTVTVTNTGTANLTVNQLSATGAGISATGFTAPLTLAAGQSSTFTVQFAPQTSGAASGTISLTSNAPNASSVSVSGTGVAATTTLSASPATLAFGNVNTGTSANQNITITNTGNSSATISQISVNGANVSASGISTPMTLAAAQSAVLHVQYSPTAATALNGLITISNAQGQTSTVNLTGAGAQANLAISPGSVSFSNVVTGNTNSQSVQLSNTGNASVTVSQANLTGSGFSLSGLSLPLTIAAGQTSTFGVQFTTQSAGNFSGALSLVSSAANSPANIVLSASSVAATQTLQISVSSLTFGSINAGSSSSKPVTLTNAGTGSITVSQISVSGTNFSLSGAGGSLTLLAGQTNTFNVLYSPTGAESDNGSVSIVSSAAGSPASIALSGTGLAQQVQHSVQLAWSDSDASIVGYNVYRSTTSGSGYVQVNGSMVGPGGFVDSAVQSGSTYFYVTTAVDSSGTESPYSNEAEAMVP